MTESDTVFNKDKFCCVCFCEDHLQDIFLSRYVECNLHDIVKIYMDVEIHDLVKTICINCIKSLIRTHNFLNSCKEASKFLKDYIYPHENSKLGNMKFLQEFNSKLFLRKYCLTELEGSVKSYVIATCDKNGTISDDDVTEDDSNSLNVVEEKAVTISKKRRSTKYLNNGDIQNLTKETFCNKLNIAQNTTLKTEILNTNENFACLIKQTEAYNINLIDIPIKSESIKLSITTDTVYSDDDDLPLIIHRDRSLAATVQNDGTNDLLDEKIDKDLKTDCDDYFNLDNDYLDVAEDKFFESSHDNEENIALTIRKCTKISRRKSTMKSTQISCYLCNSIFERKSQWRRHLKTKHLDRKSTEYVSCDICGKQLKPMCMKTHINNVHQGKILKNKFLCPICGKLYNANQRRRHTLLHDTPKPYQCEHCAFRCSQRGNLRRHQRRHTGEKPYLCTVCGHGASQKGTLLEHMKSHEVLPNPVSCVFCQLEFATSFEYRRHRRVHKNDIATDKEQNSSSAQSKGSTTAKDGSVDESGGRVVMDANLVCPICRKQLMSESGFKCHVRAHKESSRYRCHHCSKSFTSKATLEYHIRIHTGEKPYRCTACPKRFKQPGHLTAHMAIHANRREHRCTFCDQTFNIKFNLVEHLRIHTGDTIDCEFCGKKFRHNSNRRKHIRETHPGEVKAVRR